MARRSAIVRILTLVLAAAVALTGAACTGSGDLGGPVAGGTPVMTIGDDFVYTAAQLEDEAASWASNPAFVRLIGIEDVGVAGKRPMTFVSFVLSHRIQSEQARQVAATQGQEPSAEDVATTIIELDETPSFADPATGGPLFAAFEEDFRQLLGTDIAYQSVIGALLQNPTLDTATLGVPEVELNPKYGTFEVSDPGFGQVAPPEGPRPVPLRFEL